MSSRDAILGRIRSALAGSPPVEPPPPAEVWPRLRPDAEAMAQCFVRELECVHGETIRCRTMAEAQQRLAAMIADQQWESLGVLDRPLCHELVAALPPGMAQGPQESWTPVSMAGLSAGVIAPECLLADTGSSVVLCATAHERLLCYLPPACVVIATRAQLVEHLPAAWETLAPRVGDMNARGEFVLITGPSRTADIEKILILGVHGPKRLTVLLVD